MSDELAEGAPRQIVGREKAVASAADHGLAAGREGIGVMGIAGILAAFDGGEDPAVLHHVEQVEIAKLAARTRPQAEAARLGHRSGESIGTGTKCLGLAEGTVFCRQSQAESEAPELAASGPLDAPGDGAAVRRKAH